MDTANNLNVGGYIAPGGYTDAQLASITPQNGSLVWNTVGELQYFNGTDYINVGHQYCQRRGLNPLLNRNNTVLGFYSFTDTLSNGGLIAPLGVGGFRTDYNGNVLASYNFPHVSTTVARASLATWVSRHRAGAFENFAHDASYTRNAGGHQEDTCSGTEIIPCEVGDIFRLAYIRNAVAGSVFDLASVTLSGIKL